MSSSISLQPRQVTSRLGQNHCHFDMGVLYRCLAKQAFFTLQVLVNLAGPALQAMPFGAPVSAVIGAVYARAAQVRDVVKSQAQIDEEPVMHSGCLGRLCCMHAAVSS